MKPIPQHEPVLQWALVDGQARHVSEFAHLPPRQRPPALCPVCRQPVIMRLGKVRAHHVAHQPGAVCTATQPETVIHLNAKFHLQTVLQQATSLKIVQSCVGRGGLSCKRTHDVAYLRGWDRVEVEYPLGPYRLDVALLRAGAVIGAVEIRVTHPCEDEKIAFLQKRKVAWLEIAVTPAFYTPPTAWDASRALDPERYNEALLNPWQCPDCQRAEEEARRRESERERRKAYARQFETLLIRIVDFYYPSGKAYRVFYTIEEKYQGEKPVMLILQRVSADERRYLKTISAPFPENAIDDLKQTLRMHLKDLKHRKPDWKIDNSLDWRKPYLGFHPKNWNTERYPFRYKWDGQQWQKVTPRPAEQHFGQKTASTSPRNAAPAPLLLFAGEYTCRECGQKTSDWIIRYNSKECLCRKCGYKNNPPPVSDKEAR